jgi:hypothetical protein
VAELVEGPRRDAVDGVAERRLAVLEARLGDALLEIPDAAHSPWLGQPAALRKNRASRRPKRWYAGAGVGERLAAGRGSLRATADEACDRGDRPLGDGAVAGSAVATPASHDTLCGTVVGPVELEWHRYGRMTEARHEFGAAGRAAHAAVPRLNPLPGAAERDLTESRSRPSRVALR